MRCQQYQLITKLHGGRFDLLNIMIDEVDDVADKEIAKHIIAVHQKRDQSFAAKYNMTQIQRYIKFARSLKPQMTQEVRSFCPFLP